VNKIYIISQGKNGFLNGRKIQEAISVAHEVVHAIKVKKLLSMVVTLNLSKAYYKAIWNYLRLMLIHIGFKTLVVNWIMGFLTSIYFVV
jgi:hypothetical protein